MSDKTGEKKMNNEVENRMKLNDQKLTEMLRYL